MNVFLYLEIYHKENISYVLSLLSQNVDFKLQKETTSCSFNTKFPYTFLK